MRESTVKVFFELVKRGLFSHTETTDSTENLVPSFKLQVSSDIDWGEVYRLAEEQSVIGLVSEDSTGSRLMIHGSWFCRRWRCSSLGKRYR